MNAHIITSADVTAALLRIAEVADPEDVNTVRAELSRLWRLVEASADDDELPIAFRPWSDTKFSLVQTETKTNGAYQGQTRYSAWDGAGGVP